MVAKSEELIEAAENLSDMCVAARRETSQAHEQGIKDVQSKEEVNEAIEKAELARGRFLKKARDEVGEPAIEAVQLLRT